VFGEKVPSNWFFNLLYDIIEGKMFSKAARGSKRMELLHDI